MTALLCSSASRRPPSPCANDRKPSAQVLLRGVEGQDCRGRLEQESTQPGITYRSRMAELPIEVMLPESERLRHRQGKNFLSFPPLALGMAVIVMRPRVGRTPVSAAA